MNKRFSLHGCESHSSQHSFLSFLYNYCCCCLWPSNDLLFVKCFTVINTMFDLLDCWNRRVCHLFLQCDLYKQEHRSTREKSTIIVLIKLNYLLHSLEYDKYNNQQSFGVAIKTFLHTEEKSQQHLLLHVGPEASEKWTKIRVLGRESLHPAGEVREEKK